MKRTSHTPSLSRARIYATVKRIPIGRVATYGQIARLAGLPGHARQIGYALAALPTGTTVPWHRVVNARGAISLHPLSGGVSQRMRLEKEGITFDSAGRVSLQRHGWRARVPRSRAR